MKFKKNICNFFAILLLGSLCDFLYASNHLASAGIFDGCPAHDSFKARVDRFVLDGLSFERGKGFNVSKEIGEGFAVKSITTNDAGLQSRLADTMHGLKGLDGQENRHYHEIFSSQKTHDGLFAPLAIFLGRDPIGYLWVFPDNKLKGSYEILIDLMSSYDSNQEVHLSLLSCVLGTLLPTFQRIAEEEYFSKVTVSVCYEKNYLLGYLLDNGFVSCNQLSVEKPLNIRCVKFCKEISKNSKL